MVLEEAEEAQQQQQKADAAERCFYSVPTPPKHVRAPVRTSARQRHRTPSLNPSLTLLATPTMPISRPLPTPHPRPPVLFLYFWAWTLLEEQEEEEEEERQRSPSAEVAGPRQRVGDRLVRGGGGCQVRV